MLRSAGLKRRVCKLTQDEQPISAHSLNRFGISCICTACKYFWFLKWSCLPRRQMWLLSSCWAYQLNAWKGSCLNSSWRGNELTFPQKICQKKFTTNFFNVSCFLWTQSSNIRFSLDPHSELLSSCYNSYKELNHRCTISFCVYNKATCHQLVDGTTRLIYSLLRFQWK